MRVGDLARTPAGDTVLVVADERDELTFREWVLVQWANGRQCQIPRIYLTPLFE
jgi:hypothetical protein